MTQPPLLPFSLAELNDETGPYPSQIGVFCDDCGTTFTGDYVVHTDMTRTERLAVARKHLTDNEGWDCGAAGDLCPACKGDEPGMCPACDTAAIERCVGCGSCRCVSTASAPPDPRPSVRRGPHRRRPHMPHPLPSVCHRGHRLDKTNLRYDCRGVRQCRLCRIDVERAYRNRRFAKNHPGHNVIMLSNNRRYCLTCIRGEHDVDEIAVERAASGDPPARLSAAEREAAVLQLRSAGLTLRLTAERVGCHIRTVSEIYRRARQRTAA